VQGQIKANEEMMLKRDLIRRIVDQNPLLLYRRDAEKVVNAILDEIIAALARGDRVEIRGFGVFSVKSRPARSGRNPRTQAAVAVEKKNHPVFRSGREIRKRLNPSVM
jgi:integration host factor subunit beta